VLFDVADSGNYFLSVVNLSVIAYIATKIVAYV